MSNIQAIPTPVKWVSNALYVDNTISATGIITGGAETFYEVTTSNIQVPMLGNAVDMQIINVNYNGLGPLRGYIYGAIVQSNYWSSVADFTYTGLSYIMPSNWPFTYNVPSSIMPSSFTEFYLDSYGEAGAYTIDWANLPTGGTPDNWVPVVGYINPDNTTTYFTVVYVNSCIF